MFHRLTGYPWYIRATLLDGNSIRTCSTTMYAVIVGYPLPSLCWWAYIHYCISLSYTSMLAHQIRCECYSNASLSALISMMWSDAILGIPQCICKPETESRRVLYTRFLLLEPSVDPSMYPCRLRKASRDSIRTSLGVSPLLCRR